MDKNCSEEVQVHINAIRYEMPVTEKQEHETYYTRKLFGRTAYISSIRGSALAEKRFHAKRADRHIKVRAI